MNLAPRIELYLLQKQGWVSASEICQHFEISDERKLRGKDGKPGILADFAASSTRQGESGYCHHRFLTTAEWLPVKHRIKRHSVSQMRSIRHQDNARHNILTGKRPDLREVHGGQGLLFAL